MHIPKLFAWIIANLLAKKCHSSNLYHKSYKVETMSHLTIDGAKTLRNVYKWEISQKLGWYCEIELVAHLDHFIFSVSLNKKKGEFFFILVNCSLTIN